MSTSPGQPSAQPPKLLDPMQNQLRRAHLALDTEKAYLRWARQYILFHDKRHPKEMGEPEIDAFLTYLAVDRQVAASTQNRAFSALLFLYRKVLRLQLKGIDAVRAKQPRKLPAVLSTDEVRQLLETVERRGPAVIALIVELLYGTGMRIRECCRLRIKDIDFQRGQIVVREGKGAKDRMVPLPRRTIAALQRQIQNTAKLHEQDLLRGHGDRTPTGIRRLRPGAQAQDDCVGHRRLHCLPRDRRPPPQNNCAIPWHPHNFPGLCGGPQRTHTPAGVGGCR